MTTNTRLISEKDRVRVPRRDDGRPALEVFRSEGNRYLFVRLAEEEKDDDTLVSLYRLLEGCNIDVDRAMDSWSRIRAMKLPSWIERRLRKYYFIVELTEEAWLAGGL